MPRNPSDCISDMLEAIGYINEDLSDHSFDDFLSDRVVRQAVERNLEVISEASRGLTEELVSTEPDIDWRGIRIIGNILRHRYGDVDPEELWGQSIARLPEIKEALLRIRALPALTGKYDPSSRSP